MDDIKAVLFDLDGTLLPLDFDAFFPGYVARVGSWYLAHIGRDITRLSLACAARMIENDGARSNADVFWTALCDAVAIPRPRLEQLYAEFVASEGPGLAGGLVPDPHARAAIDACRRARKRVILATNPVFPSVMIDERLRWAGLARADFDLVTCSEQMRFCKPRSGYYEQIADELEVRPDACLMIGNDIDMDLAPAARVGMRTCLLESTFTVQGESAFHPDLRCTLADLPALLPAESGHGNLATDLRDRARTRAVR